MAIITSIMDKNKNKNKNKKRIQQLEIVLNVYTNIKRIQQLQKIVLNVYKLFYIRIN